MTKLPDEWQKNALQEIVSKENDAILMCSRQVGKTEVVAAAAYIEACVGGFVLVASPSDEQSKEFLSRLADYHNRLKLVPSKCEPTKHELLLTNGGRVLAKPNNERTIRVYASVTLLVIDEAARVPDELYGAVRPMLAVSGGRTVLLSTPFGKRGFFYREWCGEGRQEWVKYSVPWSDCPRLSAKFIESERHSHGDVWVQQEYECQFLDIAQGYFDVDAFERCVEDMEVDAW